MALANTPSGPWYRCHASLGADGRWRRWRFAPPTTAALARAKQNARRRDRVLFASVQTFAPPVGAAGNLTWRSVRDQYRGPDALPHRAPLYFDIDAEDLGAALDLGRHLVGFFIDDLGLPEPAVRVWFSGSKGFHLLVSAASLGVEPSPTLTVDMKTVAVGLARHVAAHGAPAPGTDASVYSLPRMLRAADEANRRSGLYKVELRHKELLELSTSAIQDLARSPRGPLWRPADLAVQPVSEAVAWWAEQVRKARQPREFRRRTAALAGVKVRPDGFAVDRLRTQDAPACIRQMLAAVVPAGRRNRCELQIACWAKGAGLSQEDALALLGRWTARNRPDLGAGAATRKAASIVGTVYGGARYGFSCAAARVAAREARLAPDCRPCRAIRRRSLKQLASLREAADAQWVPPRRIELEEARARITTSLTAVFARVAADRHARQDAAGDREDVRRPAFACTDVGTRDVRHADA